MRLANQPTGEKTKAINKLAKTPNSYQKVNTSRERSNSTEHINLHQVKHKKSIFL